MPDNADQLSHVERLIQLKLFIALDSESEDQYYPALPSGKQTALQVYQHAQGTEQYKAQVVRFNVGKRQFS